MSRAGVTVLTALLVSFGLAASGAAQGPPVCSQFRVEWNRAEESSTSEKLTGVVYNESRCRVTDVRLHVVALDAEGHPVAETSGWVFGDIRAGGRGYFAVPLTAPAAGYQVNVVSFDKVSDDGG